MYNEIISLEETSNGVWKAKYRGNYGTYSIRIQLKGNVIESFSCSCPSDYYPCKHIAMIKEEIDARVFDEKMESKDDTYSVEDVLKNVSQKDLKEFMVRYAKYNPDFANTVVLELIQQSPDKKEVSYSTIIRKALKKIDFDYEDLDHYYDDCLYIDILDEWLAKAEKNFEKKQYDDAFSICKACIEEYATWADGMDGDILEYVDISYQETPFDLLHKMIESRAVSLDELYHYCITEMEKPKYEATIMFDGFNHLLTELAKLTGNAEGFIALQDSLLQKIDDKASYEAQNILERKIEFYINSNQPEKAFEILTANIQIENFRKQIVEQKINAGKFKEAKGLINEFLNNCRNENSLSHNVWNELSLKIARKESDIPVIRKISFSFIKTFFQVEYYRIYKSTFTSDEWKTELQNIISHYEKQDKFFNCCVADILAEEKDAPRLLMYIERYLSLERLETYYVIFRKLYPTETLELFHKALNNYAEHNTGREHYEHIVKVLKKISDIEGGIVLAKTLVSQYKLKYKNRRAMMEILNKSKF